MKSNFLFTGTVPPEQPYLSHFRHLFFTIVTSLGRWVNLLKKEKVMYAFR